MTHQSLQELSRAETFPIDKQALFQLSLTARKQKVNVLINVLL